MKILLLRNVSDKINVNSYNVQEIGLAKALVRKGHECDIVLYTDEEKYRKEVIEFEQDRYITLHWVKGISLYHNAIYIKLIRDKFFDHYDIIQTHEYNQIMTFLLPHITKTKKIIYHGPYNDIKNKFAHHLFDLLFLRNIKTNYSFILTKSNLARDYLKQKGFIHIKTVGVGLDTDKFKNTIQWEKSTFSKLQNKLGSSPTLLYIGKIEERRNIEFILKILYELKKRIKFNFLLIGDGEEKYVKKCLDLINQYDLKDTITYFSKIEQNEIRYAYETSRLFIFPSNYEIFGMVLLESLYFDCPVLSSYNGGASVLLTNQYQNMIIHNFSVNEWVERIFQLLSNKDYANIKDYINRNFTWDSLASTFIDIYSEIIE